MPEIDHATERAYQMLESLGVPRDRAGSVSNGIGVYATRMRKEIRFLSDRIPALENDLLLCRRQIWLTHGCPIASLYGDDGEMQCSSDRHRPLDFKRQPIAEILEELKRANMEAYIKSGEPR